MADLLGDFSLFVQKFTNLVENYQRQYPDLNVDVKSELEKYKVSLKFIQIRPHLTISQLVEILITCKERKHLTFPVYLHFRELFSSLTFTRHVSICHPIVPLVVFALALKYRQS